ncbi:MAG TPA: VOC family protein [Candidatus Limnocylindrales bacterium]|nr:VOC family protein [Candidatus Limnocylindrales bacterium]
MSGDTTGSATSGIGVIGIDHVQLLMPVRGEPEARRFYGAVLGLREVEKPGELAERGGCWFVGPGGTAIHIGLDQRFIPARRAHVCLIVADLTAARGALAAAGMPVVEDEANLGVARCYTADPFGNRIELVDAADAGFTAP